MSFDQNGRKSRMPHSRRHERPRSSRSQHSNPGGTRCLSSASVAQIIAAASIKVVDALFGFPARNDAECCKRELLGRSWRRDWAMHRFHVFLTTRKNFASFNFFCETDALGKCLKTLTPINTEVICKGLPARTPARTFR